MNRSRLPVRLRRKSSGAFVAALVAAICSSEGRAVQYGNFESIGNGHSVYRAAAQRATTDDNYVAVGRTWSGSQFKALIGGYRVDTGAQDLGFAVGSGVPGKWVLDLSGDGLESICNAVVYAYDGFIAACRSKRYNNPAGGDYTAYYDVYLVKFDNLGNRDATFGTNGVVRTSIAGNSTNGYAFVTGIVYNPNVNTANHGVVTVVGRAGFYSPGVFHPFIASFDQKTGALYGTKTELTGIAGSAVSIAYDSTAQFYYVASTESTGNGNFYLHQFDNSLVASASPWGDPIDFSASFSYAPAHVYSSSPSSVALIGTDVIVVGGNKDVTDGTAWRCAVVAIDKSSGNPNTSFGRNTLSGGLNDTGFSMFTHDASWPCIVQSVSTPPSGTDFLVAGAAYVDHGASPKDYDQMSAKLDSVGALVATYGTNGILLEDKGYGDDVWNSLVYLKGDVTKFYTPGRSRKPNGYDALIISESDSGAGSETPPPPGNDWAALPTTNAPSGRESQSTVWTGTQLIVWGGYAGSTEYNTGAMYDPVADAWTATSTGTNVPSVRDSHCAVWTGTVMLVWGGYSGSATLSTGRIFDPSTNSWSTMATTGAPTARSTHGCVWTGTQMIVWGGFGGSGDVKTGARYNYPANTWSTMTSTGAPSAREVVSAVWTGTEMLVWGGYSVSAVTNTGGRYNPSTDTWSAITTTGAPSARQAGSVIWTGEKLLVWGGWNGSSALDTGGIYDPSNNSWTAMTTTNVPRLRYYQGTVWTGDKMIIWGGNDRTSALNSGGVYDPVADTWTATSTTSAPIARDQPSAAWTGEKAIFVTGRTTSTTYTNTGGAFTPP